VKLTPEQIRGLLRLTNPALHEHSELSVRATAFLEKGLTGKPIAHVRKRISRKPSKRISTYATAPATPSVAIVDDELPNW
jgi:hypothetical protein